MAGRFDKFEETPLGQALFALTQGKERRIEFEAFSREGFPAVTALVSLVAKIFADHNVTETKVRNFAKQSVGAWIAPVMIDAGYTKVGQRSVPGKTFSVGALWAK